MVTHATRPDQTEVVTEGEKLQQTRMSWLRDHPYAALFFGALVLRLLLVAASEVFADFTLDDFMYQRLARDMSEGEISNWDDFTYSLYWRTAAFLGPVTLLYKVLGPTMVIGQIYVAIVGATVAPVVARLAREVVGVRWAVLAGLVIALLPSQVFWSSRLMKDASVWLALAALALAVAVANRSRGRRLLALGIGIAVALVALSFLREHTLVIACYALVLASVVGARESRIPRIAGAVVLCVAIPWVAAGVGPGGWDLITNSGSLQGIRFKMAKGANTAIVDTTPQGTEAQLNEARLTCKEIQQALQTVSDPSERERLERQNDECNAEIERLQTFPDSGKTAEQVFAEEDSLAPNLKHIPRGLSVMLLEPFPLPFTGTASLRLARLESLVWYPLVALAAIGLWRGRRRLDALAFPILAGGGILLVYALTEGNVGTAHRHRGELVWVIAVLAAVGANAVAERRSTRSRSEPDT